MGKKRSSRLWEKKERKKEKPKKQETERKCAIVVRRQRIIFSEPPGPNDVSDFRINVFWMKQRLGSLMCHWLALCCVCDRITAPEKGTVTKCMLKGYVDQKKGH
jgi:hypothetical protein